VAPTTAQLLRELLTEMGKSDRPDMLQLLLSTFYKSLEGEAARGRGAPLPPDGCASMEQGCAR
jgi:hypothetical protein